MLKMERIKDYLLMEEEFVANQAAQPGEDRTAVDRKRVDEIRSSPLQIGSLEEMIDDEHAIISSGNGPEYYVPVMSFVDKDLLEPGCTVLLHRKTHAVVGVLADDADPMVSVMKLDKAPTESYADIGGLETQIQEIKESVELPLTHPELYEEMGIRPPKGVILYGVPGTGKTLLAKAVANQTSATFLRIVGSELIQKYLGDGPKLVRELFRVAEENAPSIVFIDEIDAVGTKRYDSSSSGEREIQRTMLELLNQLDGFDTRGDVKVIMATNRVSLILSLRYESICDTNQVKKANQSTRLKVSIPPSFVPAVSIARLNSQCQTSRLNDTSSSCTLRACRWRTTSISRNSS
jgi:26S proteasome regulatory subunit T2